MSIKFNDTQLVLLSAASQRMAHFASLFGRKAELRRLIAIRPNNLRPLYLGSAHGDAHFLTV